MTGGVCSVGVDTADLLICCSCGCPHCCIGREVQQRALNSRSRVLKEARPLNSRHRFLQHPTSKELGRMQLCAPKEEICDQKPLKAKGNRESIPVKKRLANSQGFQCDLCKTVFTRKYSLTVHLRKFTCLQHQNNAFDHRSASSHCNRLQEAQADASDPADQLATPGTRSCLLCSACGKTFCSQSALGAHIVVCSQIHSDKHDHFCGICQKCFPTRASLRMHVTVHKDAKSFQCALCSAAFVKKDSLKIHLRKHTGERPFQCDVCPAAFDRRFTLKNHRTLHSEERPHVCATCGKTFSTHGTLTAHECTSHTKKELCQSVSRRKQDFEHTVCEHCGKVYSSVANLRIHARTHSGERPFRCAVCAATFAKKYTLQCHVRRHTGERPFHCAVCGAAFCRQSTLASHRRRHTGERPHCCKICGRGFIQSASLMYHLKHHEHATSPQQPIPVHSSSASSTKDV